MTIAAIASTSNLPVRESASAAIVDLRRPAHEYGGGSRRHDLIDALGEVLDTDAAAGAAPSLATSPALLRFAHALMHDLRVIDGGGEQGQPWRRERSDLPQRIDALATAAAAPARVPEAPDVPPQPMPLTATTAALHLMQVPSSHLLAAFSALRKVLGEQSSDAIDDAPLAELASLLSRLSKELVADSRTTLPAGSVLNLRA